MIIAIVAGIVSGVILALAWLYCQALFGLLAIFLLMGCLVLIAPVEEVDEDLEREEMCEWVREEVHNALNKSLRKHKAKYVENALTAYQELYGKDDFYQEIWHEVYKEFYKEKEKEE